MTVEKTLRALCVARHEYLAEHFARFFSALGIEAEPVVGIEQALDRSRAIAPDVVLCDYELLSTFPIDAWERDAVLSSAAVMGVSLTRRPAEMHLLGVNGIAGFLYLPTLDRTVALRIISAAAASARAQYRAQRFVSQSRASEVAG